MQTQQPEDRTMTTAIVPETSTWQLDATHSSIGFSVKHLMIATVRGSFAKYEASFSGSDNDLSDATVNVNIETASIDTGNAQRDGHLRSPDFFDAEKFPAITFAGKKVVGNAFGDFKIIGDLTISGVTKEITLDASFEGRAKDPWGNSRLGYSAKGKINRSDFGLTWNQALEAGGVVVSEEVKISVEASFVRQ
jgi:polyisoprenoid-binding protein YceI